MFFMNCYFGHLQLPLWAFRVHAAQSMHHRTYVCSGPKDKKSTLFPEQSLCRHTLQTWMACFIIPYLHSKVSVSDFSCFCISLLVTPISVAHTLKLWKSQLKCFHFFFYVIPLVCVKVTTPPLLHFTEYSKNPTSIVKAIWTLIPQY